MVLVLLDEPTLIVFASPDTPPADLETEDVMDGLFSFCDEPGQRYEGVITRPAGWFRAPEYGLRPQGPPDVANVWNLVERAVAIEPNEWFADPESLRRHLRNRAGIGTPEVENSLPRRPRP